MKIGIIYKPMLARTRSLVVEADNWRKVDKSHHGLGSGEFFVEHVVDFEGQRIIPVAMGRDGTLVEIVDDTYGEATTDEMLVKDYKKEKVKA